MTRSFLGIPVLILAASVSLAQMNTGSLSGTITDANGAIVPAAKVTARNIAAGQDYQTLSTEAGLYVFASLPVGAYSVTFEKTGFKKLNRGNIEIRVAQRQTLDVALEVGDVQQTVEVTAEAPLLEATTSERGQSFSNKFMDTLPLFTGGIRNPRAFTGYMPGVNDAAERSVNGSGGRAEEVMIDGASLIIPESGGTVFYMPSAEMFGEFKLLTSNYSAEYGRFGGGVELFITKSGTNQLHGRASGTFAAISSTPTPGISTAAASRVPRFASTSPASASAARSGSPRSTTARTGHSGLSPIPATSGRPTSLPYRARSRRPPTSRAILAQSTFTIP